jgi:hypothetical protein
VSNKDSGLVEHLLGPACIFVCKDFYVISESNKGTVNWIDLDFQECQKYLKQKDGFKEFHHL